MRAASPNRQRRLCIYFFYDSEGIVDDYVIDCLSDMSKNVEHILFVSNSQLTSDSKTKLGQKFAEALTVTERPNVGFDVWAYKHGIEHLGWDALSEYDEVIFMNFTIVGPVYPFSEMFDEMATRDVDFWGINVHSGESFDPWGIMPEGVIPKHIQSHFIVVRNSMLKSQHFKDYWDTMRPITSYQEAIGYHEAVFTQTFERLGYKWDSYINTKDLEKMTSYPLMFMPDEVIKNRRCPVFKRKALILSMEEYMVCTPAGTVTATLKVLQQVGFDTENILRHVIRTGNQTDLRMNMNATKIFTVAGKQSAVKSAIIAYADTNQKLHVLRNNLTSLSGSSKMVIVAHSRVAAEAKRLFEKNTEVIIGDTLTYLKQIGLQSKHHGMVGTIGMSLPKPSHSGLSETEFYSYPLTYRFLSQPTIQAAHSELKNNRLIAGFASLDAAHAEYGHIIDAWEGYYAVTNRFLKSIDIGVDRDAMKSPLTSAAGVFLMNGESLVALDWERMVVSLEKIPKYLRLSVFNQALPFMLQSKGELMWYGATTEQATNHHTMLLHEQLPIDPESTSSGSLATNEYQKGSLYLMKNGRFSEKNTVIITPSSHEDEGVTFEASIPFDAESMRFDPVENLGVICRDASATVNGEPRPIIAMNAIQLGDGVDFFLTKDSQYVIEGTINRNDTLSVQFASIEYFLEGSVSPTTRLHGTKSAQALLQEAVADMKTQHTQQMRKQEAVIRKLKRAVLSRLPRRYQG